MDRRRRHFVPSSEGLEDRQLLSTATAASVPATASAINPFGTATTAANTTQVVGSQAATETVEARLQRIQGLPFFLGQLNRFGEIPQPAVSNIQNDLSTLVGQLHPGQPSVVATFNHDIRRAEPYLKIRPQDASDLNRDFGAVLDSAGARPEVVADLQKQMVNLTNFATTQRNSRIVATNDYSLVLQLALESGRPLETPAVPNLLGSDHNGNKGKVQVTHNSQPSLTGNYIAGTNVQIVNANNQQILGVGTVDPNTRVYSVKFANKLADGIYTVRVRGEDLGYLSPPSPRLSFEVITPHKAK